MFKTLKIKPLINVKYDKKPMSTPRVGSKYLDTDYPELVPYFNVEKNALNGIGIRTYTAQGHERKIWWQCPCCKSEQYLFMYNFVKKKNKCKNCRFKEKARKNCVDCGAVFHTYDTFKITRCKECIVKKNDSMLLINKRPELIQHLSQELNPEVDFNIITIGYTKLINWQCDKCSSLTSSTSGFLIRNGLFCKICDEKEKQIKKQIKKDNLQIKREERIKKENIAKEEKKQKKLLNNEIARQKRIDENIKYLFEAKPNILAELHLSNINKFDTHQKLSRKSDKKLLWACSTCQHEWTASIRTRIGGKRQIYSGCLCPKCSSFASVNTEKFKDWDISKNINIDPYTIAPQSAKYSYYWICHDCKQDWKGKIVSCCPRCYPVNSSIIERKLYYLFTTIFGSDNVKNSFRIKGRTEIDIFIFKYNIGIEYDGVYFHKDNISRDKQKNVLIKKLGYHLFRVRELGLKKLSKSDFVHNYKNNLKEPFLYILNCIKDKYNLSPDELLEIDKAKTLDFDNLNIPKAFLIYPLIENSLKEIRPDISKLFHPIKNLNLTTSMITEKSSYKCWWNCVECGGEYNRMVHCVVKKNGKCPKCYNPNHPSKYLTQEFINEFNTVKNKIDVANLAMTKYYWWKCSKCNNEWEASLKEKIKGKQKCRNCYPRILKDSTRVSDVPTLLKEWDMAKNTTSPYNIPIGSNSFTWWKCDVCEHEWKSEIEIRGRIFKKTGEIIGGCSICKSNKLKI